MASNEEITVTSEEWEEYKKKFNKTYEEKDEEFRKNLFLESKKKVHEHNKKYETGEVTYSCGINQFSDLTKEEISARTCGLRKPKD